MAGEVTATQSGPYFANSALDSTNSDPNFYAGNPKMGGKWCVGTGLSNLYLLVVYT